MMLPAARMAIAPAETTAERRATVESKSSIRPDALRQLLREMEVEVGEHAPDLVCEAPVGDLFSAGKERLLLLLELPLGDLCFDDHAVAVGSLGSHGGRA
jgi:hypothetical protein